MLIIISHNKVWFRCFTFMFTPSNCLRFFVFLRLVLKFASTKIQRLYQLGQFKQDQEASNSGKPLKSDELYNRFSQNLVVTAGEKLSKSYVDLAMRLWDTVLAKTPLRNMLLLSDEVFGKKASPFNSIYKLEAMMQAAAKGGQPALHWIILFASDMTLNGGVKAQELSVLALTGGRSGQKGCQPKCLHSSNH